MTRYIVGVDIGGTFTDVVLRSSAGVVHTHKTLTTPDDFGRGIAEGISQVLTSARAHATDVDRVVHATTVATNAILEHKGARTGLITTRGFRDVLEMRRLRIPEMYTLNYRPPVPLVPRRWRLEVDERMAPDGSVRVALDEASVLAAADRLGAAKIESIAISLIHAYANPAHEQRIAAILRERLGEGVYITCSSDILPVIREYERTSTTVINAFLGPALRGYFDSLRRHFSAIGIDAPIHVMKSDGGVMTVNAAVERPAALVESGPAAGVIGAAAALRSRPSTEATTSLVDAITFDMGGTTAKVSLIERGEITRTGDYEVGAGINLSSKLVMGGGYALKLPVIDISEVGAGGGSLVSIDAGGLLRVGPQSAGAQPGPVCYDRGGAQATFTDAALTLGYISPLALAGGGLRLNAQAGRDAIAEQVGKPLGRDPLEAAYGVFQVACGTMVRAVKAVSTYRGRDPRDFALYAFGGNGPVVAAAIADLLEMKRVVVPLHPGVFSAVGLLVARIEHEAARAYLQRLRDTTPAELAARFDALETQVRNRLREDGFDATRLVVQRLADMRYTGQAHELTVPVASGVPDFAAMARDFGNEHARTYGHQAEREEVECVTLRVVARVVEPLLDQPPVSPPRRVAERRTVFFGAEHGVHEVTVLGRGDLDALRQGPLIVEEYDATCVVPPGWAAALDPAGNIVLTRD